MCDASSCVDIRGMFSSSTCMQGQSWCIGGDSNASTIASFLRFYTPDIQGASLGTHLASVLTHCLTFYIAASFFDYSSFTLFFPRQDPIYLHTYVLPPPPPPPPPHTLCPALLWVILSSLSIRTIQGCIQCSSKWGYDTKLG